MSDPDRTKGLYKKYDVTRLSYDESGNPYPSPKHLNCNYYVLDLNHDKFAHNALRAYAKACKSEYPELSADLFKLTRKPSWFARLVAFIFSPL